MKHELSAQSFPILTAIRSEVGEEVMDEVLDTFAKAPSRNELDDLATAAAEKISSKVRPSEAGSEHLCLTANSIAHASGETCRQLERKLTALGSMGWEVVAIDSPPGVQNCGIILRRPMRPSSGSEELKSAAFSELKRIASQVFAGANH